MPRVCTICTHPDRPAVEAALRGGTLLRTIAARWSVSKTALLRHRDKHGRPQRQTDRGAPLAAKPVPKGPSAVAGTAPATCAVSGTVQAAVALARLLGVDVPALTLDLIDGSIHRLHEDVAAQMILQQCPDETRARFQDARALFPDTSDAHLIAALLTTMATPHG
jgi:hypothetical protein